MYINVYIMPSHDGHVRLYPYLAMCEVSELLMIKQAFKKHADNSTLVARGADTQLDPNCVSAPLATNVDFWNPIGCNTSVIKYFNKIFQRQTICRNE